jgi:hypothetical protein
MVGAFIGAFVFYAFSSIERATDVVVKLVGYAVVVAGGFAFVFFIGASAYLAIECGPKPLAYLFGILQVCAPTDIDALDAAKHLASETGAALPNIATDLTAMAVDKRGIAESVINIDKRRMSPDGLDPIYFGSQNKIFERRIDDLARHVANLNEDISILDPTWRGKNITTLTAVRMTLSMREATVTILQSAKVGKNGEIAGLGMNASAYASLQRAEADELDKLARILVEPH